MTINKAILVGNLGRDPEVRSTQSGTKIATLSIATTERQKGADGQWGDHTEWHRVVCFGRTAENAERFLSKGRQVYVEGKLRTQKYTDKSGVEKYSTEIIADDLRFLGKQDGGGRSEDRGSYGGQQSGGGQSSGGGYGGGHGGGYGDDSDVPF